MSKTQFYVLNVVGGICAFFLLANLLLTRSNESSGQTLGAVQTQLNRAQQVQTTAQNLLGRIARASQSEPALRDLLTRQDLKVNLSGEATTKAAP